MNTYSIHSTIKSITRKANIWLPNKKGLRKGNKVFRSQCSRRNNWQVPNFNFHAQGVTCRFTNFLRERSRLETTANCARLRIAALWPHELMLREVEKLYDNSLPV